MQAYIECIMLSFQTLNKFKEEYVNIFNVLNTTSRTFNEDIR